METMKMSDIKREPIAVHEWSDERIVTLASEAEEVLGYKKLREVQETKVEEAPISFALAKLEIEVLNEADVMRYRNEMQIERTKAKFEAWLNQSIRDGFEVSTFIGSDWNLTKIDVYRQPIPEFVLNKAVQIKKACPEAFIFIDHLEDTPDPFLVIMDSESHWNAKEKYYVEVWDEPKFEGRMR